MITVNFDKAKTVAHRIRRDQRADEFRPFDQIVVKQIPGEFEAAEAARVAIREKYAAMQTQIDTAGSVDELHEIVGR